MSRDPDKPGIDSRRVVRSWLDDQAEQGRSVEFVEGGGPRISFFDGRPLTNQDVVERLLENFQEHVYQMSEKDQEPGGGVVTEEMVKRWLESLPLRHDGSV